MKYDWGTEGGFTVSVSLVRWRMFCILLMTGGVVFLSI